MLDKTKLLPLLEALLLAAGKPLREEDLLALFSEEERPSKTLLRQALKDLQESFETRGIRLVEIASGFQFQIHSEWAPWVSRLWEEKAPRYSRALLETLALIAYRQPITRGEIEDIRGVSISQSIFKTLLEERDWIRVVGHKEVPGKPALYATTKLFLDYFGLKTLEELPALPDIMNMETEAANEDERVEKFIQMALIDNKGEILDEEIDGKEENHALKVQARKDFIEANIANEHYSEIVSNESDVFIEDESSYAEEEAEENEEEKIELLDFEEDDDEYDDDCENENTDKTEDKIEIRK